MWHGLLDGVISLHGLLLPSERLIEGKQEGLSLQ